MNKNFEFEDFIMTGRNRDMAEAAISYIPLLPNIQICEDAETHFFPKSSEL